MVDICKPNTLLFLLFMEQNLYLMGDAIIAPYLDILNPSTATIKKCPECHPLLEFPVFGGFWIKNKNKNIFKLKLMIF